MKKFIISVLGQDQPGIIAAVTRVLFEQDFNIEDVSQTILQVQFSSIFIVTGPDQADPRGLCNLLTAATHALKCTFTSRNWIRRRPGGPVVPVNPL
jgi:predicted amino acid-binding ACT domain protein